MSHLCRLHGKRVVVTRAPHQAGEVADLLRERGATPVLYPCIEIVPPGDRAVLAALDEALRGITAFDWLILTSANTVEAIRTRLGMNGISPAWGPALKVAAVGGRTAVQIRAALGLGVDFIPQVHTAAHLGAELPLQPGERVLLPSSAIAAPALAQILTRRGADVTTLTAYETALGTGGADMASMLQAGRIDALTFTSSSTVTNFVKRLGYTPAEMPAACIGEITAQTAQDAGFQHVLTPQDDYSLDSLIAVMENDL